MVKNAYWTQYLITNHLKEIMPTVTQSLLDIMPTGQKSYHDRNTFMNENKKNICFVLPKGILVPPPPQNRVAHWVGVRGSGAQCNLPSPLPPLTHITKWHLDNTNLFLLIF